MRQTMRNITRVTFGITLPLVVLTWALWGRALNAVSGVSYCSPWCGCTTGVELCCTITYPDGEVERCGETFDN